MVARGIISSTPLCFFSRVFYWTESAYEPKKPAVETALIEALRSLIFSPGLVPGPTNFHLPAIIAVMDVKNLMIYPINTAFGDSELVASKVLQSVDDTKSENIFENDLTLKQKPRDNWHPYLVLLGDSESQK
jgi:hypothetical protein